MNVIFNDPKFKCNTCDHFNNNKILLTPTASSFKDNRADCHPKNAIDGNKDTFFAAQGTSTTEFWQSEFKNKGTKISYVEIISRKNWWT